MQAVHPHIFQREDLVSFLCFIVLSGEGELCYEGQTYQLSEGDCVFIDCQKAYSHSTGYKSGGDHTTVDNHVASVENKDANLWSFQWCHFYAPFLPAVYEKYKELAEKEDKVIFGGRLGEYKYYDMDKVIAAALSAVDEEFGK